MRRKRKLLLKRISIIIIVALIIFLIYKFIKPNKPIATSNANTQQGEVVQVTTVDEPTVDIDLPENISNNDNDNSSKTYTPATTSEKKYLVSILSNNEVTVLIGNDSEELLNSSSKVSVGGEYKVNGIEDEIKTVYYFNVDGYDYPIFLLLSKTGTLYYVDIQKAYSTGNFVIGGYISDIPEVDKVYETNTEENGQTYRSAVIVCQNGEGYEFDTSMIGR